MPDQQIMCGDCRQTFVWSEGEQKFYADSNFTPPKRCKPCRDKRKAQRKPGDRKSDSNAKSSRPDYSNNRRG